MISKLRDFLDRDKKHPKNFDSIWRRIQGIILLTLLPIASDVSPHSYSCFEMFGFGIYENIYVDIILDESFKPWLLEVNLSPALAADSDTDVELKKPLLRDLIGLTTLDINSKKEAPFVHEDSKSSPRSAPLKIGANRQVIDSNANKYPEGWGGFERIYPFDEFTRRNGNARVGDAATKKIVQSIKRRFS